MSGRIAAQLASRRGARVVAAGRNQKVLGQLAERGAHVTVAADRPRAELAAAITAAGPYDLIVDYLWGAAAEATFDALIQAGRGAALTRYILVGMAAGEVARLPAMALRRAPVQLAGSGIGGQAPLAEAAAGYDSVLRLVSAGEIEIDCDPVPLADVERVWARPGSGRRVVLVPGGYASSIP
jgi:NADPH:quinone reductase-like Zn-dependent oxidoreductase